MKKKFIQFLLFHEAYEYFVYEFYGYRNRHKKAPCKTVDEYLSKVENWNYLMFLKSAFSWLESTDEIYWAQLHNKWMEAIKENNFPEFEFKLVTQ